MGIVQHKRPDAERVGEQSVDGKVTHRPRSLGQRPLWQRSDLAIAGSLLALLPPAWALPERAWWPLCRAVARTPGLVDQTILAKTIAGIAAALPEPDPMRARAIALDLQAAVYELRMQNLRGWRPGGEELRGWRPDLNLRGEEHLNAVLERGKGAILWVAHFAFNGGITKMALHRHGHQVSHLSRPEHGFSKTRFGIACLNPVRCAPEDRYLQQRIVYDRHAPSTAMRRMMRVLKDGGIISITAGAWEGSGIAEAPLLGGVLSLATGAPRLAAMTGAEILPVFSVRDGNGQWLTAIERPLDLPRERSQEELSAAAAAEYLRRHEPWVRAYPEQWRGWKEWRQAPTSRSAAR
jgi:lauroyl/myristoyl acyltransferase